ncbi:MAG TPA: sugar phosphate nucleotidyltransferase [Tepidisphaeraceae bacterium]|jgi:mannose-1-phosphate guanylyltransferase
MNYGVIMAGGAGTRLWPLSRGNRPKQLLPVVKGKSLLRLAYERLAGILPPERIFICTSAQHAGAILADLPELPKENLLGEPMGRDTAAAIGFTAAILTKRDPEACMAIVTADHVIEPVEKFQAAVNTGFAVVQQMPEALVTFGIVPAYGHTGLGYVHRGEALNLANVQNAYRVLAFREKPDKATADRYVESDRYYWNAGMFVWRGSTILGELAAHLPATHAAMEKIAQAWDTPNRDSVLTNLYSTLQKISIDFAVMEPASQNKGAARVVVVEMPVQWLDIGSWPTLAETLPTDDQDNAANCQACVLLDSDNNIIVSEVPDHLIATVGLSDMIIVQTKDATLICPKSQAQRVKELVAKAKEKFGDKYQ